MLKRYNRRRANAAMAMLDTVIATAGGAALILSTTAVLMAANSANDAATQNVAAYNAARQVVENLRIYKAAYIANNTYNDATVFGSIPQLTQLSGGQASVKITSPRGILKQAVVTISWRAGGRSIQRSRKLTALFAANGVAP